MADIFLRNHEEADLMDVFEISSDPLVQAFIGDVKTFEEAAEGLNFVLRNRARFKYPLKAIVHEKDAKVIGYCGMLPLKDFGPELFYGLNSKYWGKGYCRQAILTFLESEAIGIELLYATVHPENVRSQRVLENIGFGFEKEIYYEPRKMIHKLFLKKMEPKRIRD